jgi:hypothetical protein
MAAKIQEIRAQELKLLRFSLHLQAINQTLLFVAPAATAAVVMVSTRCSLPTQLLSNDVHLLLLLLHKFFVFLLLLSPLMLVSATKSQSPTHSQFWLSSTLFAILPS